MVYISEFNRGNLHTHSTQIGSDIGNIQTTTQTMTQATTQSAVSAIQGIAKIGSLIAAAIEQQGPA